MYVPHFNGYYIFGVDVVMATEDPPRDVQINSFPNVDGIEIIDFGSRGRRTVVTGKLIAEDELALGNLENIFRSYRDPYSYNLFTTEGLLWTDVQLETFRPQPPMQIDFDTFYVMRRYQAIFRHLR